MLFSLVGNAAIKLSVFSRRRTLITEMQPSDDNVLLRQYAESQSDEAFTELVARHINLVYSVALRQVGNPSHAEEIAQAVFIILAKKAALLRHEKALTSWLFQTTRLTTNNFIRSEIRRQRREQEAFMQSTQNETADAVWQQIGPALDDAVASLNEKNRRAILLRYYEGRNLREVGAVLGVSEAASEKRVARALEKLRKFFFKRGLPSAPAAIAGTISANSVQAAPVGLVKTISAVALVKGAVASASTLALAKGVLKIMAWSNTKAAIVAGAIALLIAGTATVSIDKFLTKSEPFVQITGKGQIELYNSYFNKSRIVETANMTIWTDGKSYRVSIVSQGDGTLKNDADDLQAQYGSDGIDTFELSDRGSPLHRPQGGFGGFAYSERFPNGIFTPPFIPLVVPAVWLAYCSSDYFNVSSNHTGLTFVNASMIWPDYVTNLVGYWTNSTLPQNITGWSRNWVILDRTNSDQPRIATELKQYPDGFKAWQFTATDPVIVGNKPLPRQITLETFFPKWSNTNINGDDVYLLRKATFVADSITVVKGSFDPLPPVTVPDLRVMDGRFTDISASYVITSHATPQGWPTRGSKAFKEAEADAKKLAAGNRAFIKSELKKWSPVVIPPSASP
jgi:RNA polymerase sigma factor (sigma-70 family)